MNLRHIDFSTDTDAVYEFMSSDTNQADVMFRLDIKCKNEFSDWLRFKLSNQYHEYRIIEDDTGTPIGFCYSYDFSLVDGRCKICIAIFKQYQDNGYGPLAAIHFIRLLLDNYPLRKIYVSVFSYNERSLKCNLQAGFEEEAVLRDYRYLNGEYHNLHILSITRERFKVLLSRLHMQ